MWSRKERAREIRNLTEIRDFLHFYLNKFIAISDSVHDELFVVTHHLLKENLDIYDSVIKLKKEGHFTTCLILGRSMLENSISLQYIYKDDTERRARNFYLYPLKDYLDRAKKQDKHHPDFPDLEKKIKGKLEEYNPSGPKEYHWDGKSAYKLFQELHLSSIYTEVYSRLSGFSHGKFRETDFNIEGPYVQFMRDIFTKHLLFVNLESLRVVSERFDLEPSAVVIPDFPNDGTDFFYSTNPKRSEAEA